jgi:hypothetical protein
MALAHLRNGDTLARLAAGFAVSVATVWRYLREAVDLLAGCAPTLATAMKRISQLAYAILDGTLIPIDRVADEAPYYSGKHRRHGVNVQVVTDAAGRLVWASPALPGSAHEDGWETALWPSYTATSRSQTWTSASSLGRPWRIQTAFAAATSAADTCQSAQYSLKDRDGELAQLCGQGDVSAELDLWPAECRGMRLHIPPAVGKVRLGATSGWPCRRSPRSAAPHRPPGSSP